MSLTTRSARRPSAAALVLVALAAAVLLALAAGCGSGGTSSPSPTPSPSVTPVVVPSVSTADLVEAAKAGDLNGFVTAVAAAGLNSALKQNIPYTVLAPNDEAFKKVGLEDLLKNITRLKAVVDYHVIPTVRVTLDDLKKGHYQAMTNSGFRVIFTEKDGAVMVNDANVVKIIEGPTWSIWVIDKVLVPPEMATPGANASAL
jgi:uncharacterized surface protein with fasciclin (FAS1) repeats